MSEKSFNEKHVGGTTLSGLPIIGAGDDPTSAISYQQLQDTAATKQGNLSDGAGTEVSANKVNINLESSGSSALVIGGSAKVSIQGSYGLKAVVGYVSGSGFSRTFNTGALAGVEYYMYWDAINTRLVAYHDSTSQFYGFDLNGHADSAAFATAINAGTLAGGEVIRFDSSDDAGGITGSTMGYSGTSFQIPNSSNANVSYTTGNGPYIEIVAGLLRAIVAESVAGGQTGQLIDVVKIRQYAEDIKAFCLIAANNSFDNSSAAFAGGPDKVQAAIEAAKTLIDSVASTVNTNQNTASTEYGNIDNLQALAGTNGANHGDLTHALLPDNATTPAVFEALAAAVALVRSDANTTAGVDMGDLLNAIGETVAQDSTYIQAFTALVNKVETVQGDLTNRLGAVEFYHNGDEFPLTANQIAGTEALDTVETGAGTGESTDVAAYVAGLAVPRDVRILVSYGPDGDVDAGIYLRNKDTGYITRATDFDESSEIEEGDVIQVLLGGSTAFADFAVFNSSLPVIGTDLIKFKLEKAAGVGDGTVTKVKLAPALAAELDAKVVMTVPTNYTIPAAGFIDITHGLLLASEPLIKSTDGVNNLSDSVLVKYPSAGVCRLQIDSSIALDVQVTFSGVAL